MNDRVFSFKRLFYFIRLEFLENSKTWLTVMLVLAAVAGGLSVLNNMGTSEGNAFLLSFFVPALLISGSIYASTAFSNMHKKSSVHQWFVLPVNDFEKLLGLLISTLIVWPLILLVLFSSVLNLVELFNLLTSGHNNGFFNPFSPVAWKGVLAYYVVHSIFFAGGAFFKKTAWLKTVLFIAGVAFLFSIVLSFSSIGFFSSMMRGDFLLNSVFSLANSQSSLNLNFGSPYAFANNFGFIAVFFKLFFYCLFPLGLWAFSYLCVREKEVRNAI